MLKDYGDLFGSSDAISFSERVIDIHEWIDGNLSLLQSRAGDPSDTNVKQTFVVQEPCHLRNVQRVCVADVLERFVPVHRLDDDGLCCGAGGAYSILQSKMAADIRERKSQGIRRLEVDGDAVVVTANPGCHIHLAAGGHRMISSVEVIAESLRLKY